MSGIHGIILSISIKYREDSFLSTLRHGNFGFLLRENNLFKYSADAKIHWTKVRKSAEPFFSHNKFEVMLMQQIVGFWNKMAAGGTKMEVDLLFLARIKW